MGGASPLPSSKSDWLMMFKLSQICVVGGVADNVGVGADELALKALLEMKF